jgi:methylated-DNA-protein-cysteine methyltransferase-like protein
MDEPEDSFFETVKEIIKSIPAGKVATYGQIARYAGNPQGARQVAWVLHSYSRKENLPWHRVINSKGGISLPHGSGYEMQKALLEKEGVIFGNHDVIDLKKYQWNPQQTYL